MQFEWDDEKAEANVKKHKLSFANTLAIFLDPYLLEFEDDKDDYGEERFSAIGQVEGKILHVAFTYRGEKIRLISVRKATPYEQKRYDDHYPRSR